MVDLIQIVFSAMTVIIYLMEYVILLAQILILVISQPKAVYSPALWDNMVNTYLYKYANNVVCSVLFVLGVIFNIVTVVLHLIIWKEISVFWHVIPINMVISFSEGVRIVTRRV